MDSTKSQPCFLDASWMASMCACGNRSDAVSLASSVTSMLKRMRWVTCAHVVSQSVPSYRHSGRYPATTNSF